MLVFACYGYVWLPCLCCALLAMSDVLFAMLMFAFLLFLCFHCFQACLCLVALLVLACAIPLLTSYGSVCLPRLCLLAMIVLGRHPCVSVPFLCLFCQACVGLLCLCLVAMSDVCVLRAMSDVCRACDCLSCWLVLARHPIICSPYLMFLFTMLLFARMLVILMLANDWSLCLCLRATL